MKSQGLKTGFLLALLLGLAACATQETQVVYEGRPAPEPEPVVPEPTREPDVAFSRSMLLADILYEARIAYEGNRLMTPSGDNALDRYRQVLQLDPGNAVALDGIEAIVLRYVDLADAAMRQGQYDQAEMLLGRAASLNPERAELLAARNRLTVARQTKVQRFDLDPKGLEGESLEVMVQLAEIARQIQRNESTFLINARTDAEGRWIYKVMREAVGGYRLRGNIDISSTPGILVMQPPG